MFSRWWCNYLKNPRLSEGNIFIGELEDIPDERFGLFLPNKREIAREYIAPVGFVLNFNPELFEDRSQVRTRLGYDNKPLIIATIGGTAVGRPLLELCASAYPLIKKEIPDIRMLLVCGPRVPPGSLSVPDGVEVKGFVPNLYEHLAACDLCITAGGGTTTLELQVLNRPFIYFPLEGHFEQEIDVGGRLRRLGVGVEMKYSTTTPESLAEEAIKNIGKSVSYPKPRTDGAKTAAQIINRILAT
jgi:predicted glycosyltransferase